jgi:hypothetical protein
VYFLDADEKEAYWASYNSKTDTFTKQYLGDDPALGTFVKITTSSKYGTDFKLHKKTQLVELAEPIINILSDTIIGDNRIINFNIIPQRKINLIALYSENAIHFSDFTMNGEKLKSKMEDFTFDTEKSKKVLSYYCTKDNEGLELKFTIPKDENPSFEMLEISFDLFANPMINAITGKLNSRSEIMMPMPFILNDAIIFKKKIEL